MYQIGILQLTQNLDEAVHGFKDGLKKHGLSAEFHYNNADGVVADLPKLAAMLADKSVDLIFACSTPAALAAVELPGTIPVVFTPVFDPIGSGLATSMDLPSGKATGVSGMVKAADKVAFINKLLPDIKKLGVLYHSKDTNAILEVENFRLAASGAFDLTELPIETPEELSNLPDMLPAGLSALFVPISRIIEENFATITYYADTMSLPIITSHAPNVAGGALGALVANHYTLGHTCAAKAMQILSGVNPGDIPIAIVEKPEILLNLFAAQNLGVTISPELLNSAKEIFE